MPALRPATSIPSPDQDSDRRPRRAAALLVPSAPGRHRQPRERHDRLPGEASEGLNLMVTTFQPWDDPKTYLALSDSGADRQAIAGGTPCSTDANFGVLCPLDPSQPLRIEGSAGNDRISIVNNEVPDAKPIQIHGNGGNDEIEDVFISTAGRVLTGGPATTRSRLRRQRQHRRRRRQRTVDGGEGDDQVRAGAGDDELWGDHYKEPGATCSTAGRHRLHRGVGHPPTSRTSRARASADGAPTTARPVRADNLVGIERDPAPVVGDYVGSAGRRRHQAHHPATRARRAWPASAATTSSSATTSTTWSTAAPATTPSRAAAATTP